MYLSCVSLVLQGQEAKYASHLDEVKAEHASLLEQAFQKAKVGRIIRKMRAPI